MSQTAIQWTNVSFTVRQGFWMKSKKILENINIAIPSGTVMGLVGPNGAGKTTAIKLGAGLLVPDTGQVMIQGYPAIQTKARKHIGLLTETQYIYHHLRLREWLLMLAGFSGMKEGDGKKRVSDVLDMFNLTERSEQLMNSLSKGQLQRAGLAQAMVHKPEILILDEPMSGLDPYWRFKVYNMLLDFKSNGGTILFSSHILIDVERLSDHAVLIEGGRVRWSGRFSELQRKTIAYEAICRTEHPEAIKLLAIQDKLKFHPEERQWILSVPVEKKEDLLKLASDGVINLESVRPLREEIEEILFAFRAKSVGGDR